MGKAVTEEGKSQLTEKQLQFCLLYAMSELRGNGVLCYAKAYGYDLAEKGAYNTCKVAACENLTKHNILEYIRSLYETNDLNDVVVDNELAFTIKQNADFGSKVAAIKEYNQLKGRIIKKIETNQPASTIIIQGEKYAEKQSEESNG